MKNLFIVSTFLFITILSCKKAKDVPTAEVVTVAERLEITPTTTSLLIGQTAQLNLRYYNNTGVLSALPSGIVWSSGNMSVATVNNLGIVSALALGQTSIKASYNNIDVTALINVVANNSSLSTITITPSGTQEILLNGTINLSAIGTNLSGGVVSGLTFNWMSDATASVQVNSMGIATGLAYGTSNITASANGILSMPTMVQVIRQGNFSGQGSMGTAKLKIENGNLKLQTSSNFSVANAPDLRIYLNNNASNINGAIQIASLSTTGQTSGARSWNVPANVTITQYRYAVVWCAQFGGVYGAVDFGQ